MAEQVDNTAKDSAGDPLIEVVYHTPVGAVASYYHRVEHQGRWLVLAVDNTQPAKQRFIPKLGEDKKPIEVAITGKDRQSTRMQVIPIDLQFTLDNYDFLVLLVESAE